MKKPKDLSQLNPRPGGSTWHIVKFKGDQHRILAMIDPMNLNIAIISTGAKTGSWVGISALLHPESISKEKAETILRKEIQKIKTGIPGLITTEEVLEKMEIIYRENFGEK